MTAVISFRLRRRRRVRLRNSRWAKRKKETIEGGGEG